MKNKSVSKSIESGMFSQGQVSERFNVVESIEFL